MFSKQTPVELDAVRQRKYTGEQDTVPLLELSFLASAVQGAIPFSSAHTQ